MNVNAPRGFGNGHFARGNGRGARKHGRNADPVLSAPSSAQGVLSLCDPPAFHLNIREVLQSKLQEEVNNMGDNPLTVDQLFPLICESCNEVSWQEPIDAPLDKKGLKTKVQHCVQDAVTRNNSSMSGEQALAFADALTEALTTIIPKTHRPSVIEAVDAKDYSNHGYVTYTENRPRKLHRRGENESAPAVYSYLPFEEPVQPPVLQQCGILFSPTVMPSVFSESGLSPVRCVVFENLPEKYYEVEAMKQQLESICSRIPGASFLNFICLPDEGVVIVSFNSKEAAASVMFAVNSSNRGSDMENNRQGVRVVPAPLAQQLQLWSLVAEKTKRLEEQWSKWYEHYKIQSPSEARREWIEAHSKRQTMNDELSQIAPPESNGVLSEEQLKRKLYLLQGLLETNHTISRVENQMRMMYGEEYMRHLKTGATQGKHSSSASFTSKSRNLIFISKLPGPLDDDAVLQFLRILGVRPVHIWRDPSSETTLCVELENVGQIFSLLRQLDATEMQFGGAIFSQNNRYVKEESLYTAAVREVGEALVKCEDVPEVFIRSLHADTLIALLEYITHCHKRRPYDSVTSNNETLSLCDVLLLSLTERCVELSSKHVAFVGALCSASGLGSIVYPIIVFRCRQSLRRVQAVQSLRAMTLIPPVCCNEKVRSSALVALLLRSMELGQTVEGYEISRLLSQTLTCYSASLPLDIRNAALRRALKGGSMLLKLATPVAPDIGVLEAIGRSSASIEEDKTNLLFLVTRGSYGKCIFESLVKSERSIRACNHALLLHQQLCVVGQLDGKSHLEALEKLSSQLFMVPRLHELASLSEGIVRHCPSLCTIAVHRILQLWCSGDEDMPSIKFALSALYRLLPHTNAVDVLESAVSCLSPPIGKGNTTTKDVPLGSLFARCLVLHLGTTQTPLLFNRLHRQRELAAFQLPPLALQVLLQSIEAIPMDGFSAEDAENIRSFLERERRRLPLREGPLANECLSLYKAIEEGLSLRHSDTFENPVFLESPESVHLEDSIKELPGSPLPMRAVRMALVAMFGLRAAERIAPEVAKAHRRHLAWLYAIYRMSTSVVFEIEVITELALRQGVQLNISVQQRKLVELSESTDESACYTGPRPLAPVSVNGDTSE